MAVLVLKDRTPYNIVKENGRWYFAAEFLGQNYSNLPKELRLVPDEMIPTSANGGGKTSYIPESSIVGYFNGNGFSRAFNAWKNSYTTLPTALSNASPGGSFLGSSTGTKTDSALIKYSSADIARQVAASASRFDENARKVAFESQDRRINTKTGEIVTKTLVAPAGWAGTAGQTALKTTTDATALARMQFSDSTYRYILNEDGTVTEAGKKVETLFLPDSSGKIQTTTIDQFNTNLTRLSIAQRKAWQKAIGSPVVDGIIKATEQAYILKAVRDASLANFSNLRSGEKGFKALDPLQYAMSVSSAQAAANRAASGVGRTTTDTVTRPETFTKAWVGEVAKKFFTEYLGQAPTEEQINNLTKLMNEKAKAKPTTSVTKSTKLDEWGSTNRTVKDTAGFGQQEAQSIIEKRAKAQTGVTGYQAATKYMDVILDMVRNPVG